MTKFAETDAGADFIATGDSRETSKQVMKAIAYHAADVAQAEAMWRGEEVCGMPAARIVAAILDTATNNWMMDPQELFWGGRSLAAIAAETEK